jgi:hypothetical protein
MVGFWTKVLIAFGGLVGLDLAARYLTGKGLGDIVSSAIASPLVGLGAGLEAVGKPIGQAWSALAQMAIALTPSQKASVGQGGSTPSGCRTIKTLGAQRYCITSPSWLSLHHAPIGRA